jgi:hypothetical protein
MTDGIPVTVALLDLFSVVCYINLYMCYEISQIADG